MVQPEEIEGIADALGAVTHKEVVELVQELAYSREEDVPEEEEITELLEKAVSGHLLETITSGELRTSDTGKESEEHESEDEEVDETIYYIVGPHAFPDFPFDLSEVIDILRLDKREVDPDKLAERFSERLKTSIIELRKDIEAFAASEEENEGEEEEEENEEKGKGIDILTLEQRYSDLLNLYYDYDSWIEGGFTDMEDEVLAISKQIDALGAAQDI